MQSEPPSPRIDPPGGASAGAHGRKPPRLPKALAGPGRPTGRPVESRRPAGAGRSGRSSGGRTVVAVLGSVAALGGSAASAAAATPPSRTTQRPAATRIARRADPLPAGELALLGLVFTTLSAAAPAIARPLLERGIAESAITQAEADAFVARLSAADSTPGAASAAGVDAGTPTPAAIALFQSVFSAIRAQLPVIAGPLVDEAARTGTITAAQASRIERRMAIRAQLGPGLTSGHTEPLFTGRLP